MKEKYVLFQIISTVRCGTFLFLLIRNIKKLAQSHKLNTRQSQIVNLGLIIDHILFSLHMAASLELERRPSLSLVFI